MKKVYIAHPLRGADREKNVEEVTKICKKITELFPDVLPISPIHAFSFLDNCGEEGEKKALDLCIELLKSCDEAWFFGEWEKSEGCQIEHKVFGNNNVVCYNVADCTRMRSSECGEYPEKQIELARWLLEEVYEPELKPCPFCGGEAKIALFGYDCGHEGNVICMSDTCPAMCRVDWGPRDICKTKAEAIAAWNRRAGNGEL